MAYWGHPDFDSPEHKHSREETRRDLRTLDRVLALNARQVRAAHALAAASPAAIPASTPANTPTCNAGEGTVAAAPSSVPPDVSGRQIDLFGRLAR